MSIATELKLRCSFCSLQVKTLDYSGLKCKSCSLRVSGPNFRFSSLFANLLIQRSFHVGWFHRFSLKLFWLFLVVVSRIQCHLTLPAPLSLPLPDTLLDSKVRFTCNKVGFHLKTAILGVEEVICD